MTKDPWSWGPCRAAMIVFVALAILPAAEGKPADNPVKAPASADADAEDAAGGGDVFLPPDRNSRQMLSRARELKDQGRYAEAVRCLGSLLDAPEDYFYTPEKRSGKQSLLSLKAQAQTLLGQMPREGRQSYELQYGACARQMLSQAVQSGDLAALAEVSRRFFHTQAGYEATLLSALRQMDQGSPLAAALMLKRLKDNAPIVDQYEPGLSITMAACWFRAGDPEKGKAILEAIRKQFPQARLRAGNAELALTGEMEKLLASAQIAEGPGLRPRQWLLYGGNAARNAATASSGPLLSLSWRVPTTSGPPVDSMLEQIQQSLREQDRWALPASQPLAVDNLVLMRTTHNLMAVDLVTGKRQWDVPCDDPFESLVDPPPEVQFSTQPQTDIGTNLRMRMWGDATFGTFSSDGQLVFAVEDLALDINLWGPRQMFFTNRRSNPNDPKPYNRLAAYNVRSGKLIWHVGGSPEELNLPLAGMFFLGPPLPLAGQLYVLAEHKGEIRLAVLDAKSGGVAWTQHLAVVDSDSEVMQDPIRRLGGVSPSYADGVLVCPTANNAIVAVDPANRSLLWGYSNYVHDPAPQRGRPALVNAQTQIDPEPGTHWINSCATLVSGRVLVTPADSNEIQCLNLVDGKLLWSKPRQEDLYLACVDKDKVVLVGRRALRALNLESGMPAWDGRQVAWPNGAVPSGTGFRNGDRYYVPLESAEVVAVDLSRGEIEHRYKSRRRVVPGNLICYHDKIISQRTGAVDAFYQLDALRAEVDQRLTTNPDDGEALAQRGEILWDEGKLSEAVAAFRRSLRIAPGPNARNLLRDALFEGLQNQFAEYRGQLEEIRGLVDEPPQQAALLRLVAGGHEKLGEYREALASYLELIDLDRKHRALEPLDKSHSVRRDRWIQMQLASLHAAAGPDVHAELDRVAAERFEAAKKDGSLDALQRHLDYFGALPTAEKANAEFVARLRRAERPLQAEFQLRRGVHSRDPARRAAALAELAALLRDAKLTDAAARCYARLASEFADVACLDGKTGRQLLEALSADDPVVRELRPASAWPTSRVALTREPQKASTSTPYGTTTIQYLGPTAPFFDELQLDVNHSPPLLTARDGWGNVRWQFNLSELMRQGAPPMTPAFWRTVVQDHLLLVVMGTKIVALDTLVPEGTSPRMLWTQDLDDQAGAASRRSVRANRAGLGPVYRGYPQFGSVGFPTNVPSAITEQLVCYQRFQRLYGVDPLTGEILWTRDDARPDSVVFGDREYLIVQPPDNAPAMVLRPADGKLLRTRSLPPANERQAPFGHCVLAWRNAGNGTALELIDPWENRPVWSANFPAESRMSTFGAQWVGVFQPAKPTAHFSLLNIADGTRLIDVPLASERAISDMHLFRSRDNTVLVLNGIERRSGNRPQSYGLQGVMIRPISRAHVYGFDREGKKLWNDPAIIEDQFLILNQPARLPLLMFACGVQESRIKTSGQPQIVLAAIDKRTGRLFQPDDTYEGLGYFRLLANPDKKTIEVQLQRDVLTLTLTDEPPKPVKATTAILKGFSRALRDYGRGVPRVSRSLRPRSLAALIDRNQSSTSPPTNPATSPPTRSNRLPPRMPRNERDLEIPGALGAALGTGIQTVCGAIFAGQRHALALGLRGCRHPGPGNARWRPPGRRFGRGSVQGPGSAARGAARVGLARRAPVAPRNLERQQRQVPDGDDRHGRHRPAWPKARPPPKASTPTNIRARRGLPARPQPAQRSDRRSAAGRSLHLRPRLLACSSSPKCSARRKTSNAAQQIGRRAHACRAVLRRGPDRGRRLGIRQRQGRPGLRRRLDHDHAGPGPARLPQRRHPRAQGDHRQGHPYIQRLHAARRRRAVQHQGRRRPTGHHRRRHRLPVQRRRIRQRAGAQAAGLLHEEPRQHLATKVSATGTTPTTTTPRCNIAKGASAGRNTARRSSRRLVKEANPDGSWTQGYIGPVYTTAINLTILQLDNAALPIYQR